MKASIKINLFFFVVKFLFFIGVAYSYASVNEKNLFLKNLDAQKIQSYVNKKNTSKNIFNQSPLQNFSAVRSNIYVVNNDNNSVSVYDLISNRTKKVYTNGFDDPYGIAINSNETRAYVTNRGNNTLSMIDLVNDTVAVLTITEKPLAYIQGIALSPDENMAYVMDTNNATIHAIDLTTRNTGSVRIVNSTDPTINGVGIALSQDGNKIYVPESFTGDTINIITVNPFSPTPVQLPLSANLGTPLGIAINGNIAFVTNNSSDIGQIFKVDLTTGMVTRNFSTGYHSSPQGIALSPDANTAYVANQEGLISVIPLNPLKSFSVNGLKAPNGIIIKDQIAYIVNSGRNEVLKTDLSSGNVIYTFSGFSNPSCIALSPDRTKAYVTNSSPSNSITVIDLGTLAVTPFNLLSGSVNDPKGIAISGTKAYVASFGSNTIEEIDLTNPYQGSVTNTFSSETLIKGPNGLAISKNGERLYFTNSEDGKHLGLIDLVNSSIVADQPTFFIDELTAPSGMTLSPDGTKAYAIYDDRTIVCIDLTSYRYHSPGPPSEKSIYFITYYASLTLFNNPLGIAVNEDDSKIYVTNNSSIVTIDLPSQSLGFNVPSGVTLFGNQALVSDDGKDGCYGVEFVNLETGEKVKTIRAVDFFTSAGLKVFNNKVYVANIYENTISVVDLQSSLVTTPFTGFSNPSDIVINPSSQKAYVSNNANSTISVIDLNTSEVSSLSVSTPSNISEPIGLDLFGNTLYIVNNKTKNIAVIDDIEAPAPLPINILSLSPEPSFSVPASIAVNSTGEKLFLVDGDSNNSRAYVILKDGTVLNSYLIDDDSAFIALSPDDSKAYITNFNGTLNVYDTTSFDLLNVYGFDTPSSLSFGYSERAVPIKKYVQRKITLLFQMDIVNEVSWENIAGAKFYRVFLDRSLTQLVYEGTSTKFFDHSVYSAEKLKRNYFLVAVDEAGVQSAIIYQFVP